MTSQPRVRWQQRHVVDVRDAAFAARTYYEQRDLRGLLTSQLSSVSLAAACEFGAGFGRMTPILAEFAPVVTGFEREPEFVAEATSLYPHISFVPVASLDQVPAVDAAFDLALTFTVLQHLIEPVVQSVARELNRVLRPGGYLLLCEETDPTLRQGDLSDPNGMSVVGRTIDHHRQLFAGYDVLCTRPRRIEPTYTRRDVGTYMLFKKPSKG